MRCSEWDFNGGSDEPEHDVAWPDSAEERVDRFGIMIAVFVLCIAFFVAAVGLRGQSFSKCSALENVTERNACYNTLRNDLLKPPAKGPDIPNDLNVGN